jgi:hypothetical protein
VLVPQPKIQGARGKFITIPFDDLSIVNLSDGSGGLRSTERRIRPEAHLYATSTATCADGPGRMVRATRLAHWVIEAAHVRGVVAPPVQRRGLIEARGVDVGASSSRVGDPRRSAAASSKRQIPQH